MKSPAFQLYAADFDMDTAAWTAPQVGVYIRLLLSAWVNGGIPNNMAEIARIARVDTRTLAKMWRQTLAKKWKLTPENMYVNNRMEIEREKQTIYREIQSKKGIAGNKIKWKDHIAAAMPVRSPEDRSSSSSSSSINKRVSKDTLVCPHQEIIKIYHNTLTELPKVVKWTTKRIKNLQTCWADKSRQSLGWWQEYFSLVKNSDFLMGKTNKFKADMEWLTIEGNLVKVVEGRYANKEDQGNDLMKWARESMDKEDVGGR
jgi:uncharacterized protein YdaU (DUF1376 family)